MSDTTWGVKVSEDFKNEIIELISKSGKQSKEFMELLISIYKAEILKQDKPQMVQELEELQALTQRIYGIFLNMGERSENLLESQAQSYEGELDQFKLRLTDLNEELIAQKEANTVLSDSIAGLNGKKAELELGAARLNEIVENQKALIASLNDKIHNLNTSLEEYISYKEKCTSVSTELDTAKNKLKEYEQFLSQKDEIIKQMKKTHQDEIKQLQDKFEIEQSKTILDLKLSHQKIIEEIQDKNNAKISALQERISQDNEKIQCLLESRRKNVKGVADYDGKG